MEIVKKITLDFFADIIAYTVAEPGAMGLPNTMELITNKGQHFMIFFEDVPFSDIKKAFTSAALHECFFNGPGSMPNVAEKGEIVIYPPNNNEKNRQTTRVAPGWHHQYMGAGNHLVIKEEKYNLFAKYIQDKSPSKIYCTLDEIIKEVFEIAASE